MRSVCFVDDFGSDCQLKDLNFRVAYPIACPAAFLPKEMS